MDVNAARRAQTKQHKVHPRNNNELIVDAALLCKVARLKS